ncbi:MAG: flagellin lysine-N-methylase [Oscillospiraceae bacterium]|nr:flagellin lysine-N-methylase [Oscillospiraceae bacterium]
MIEVYPGFYGRFVCRAERCVHSCCRGWEIDVDEKAAARYRRIPGELGELLRRSLVRTEEGFSFRLTEEGRCPLLRPDGLCRMILERGEDELCDICALHPRFYGECGEYELCGLGLSCEAVCALLLESEEPLRFVTEDGRSGVFRDLLAWLGISCEEAQLRYKPEFTQARCAEILDRLAGTEPIDGEWTEELRQLRACTADLAENAAEYAAVCPKGRYRRIYEAILFRQLERAGESPFSDLAAFARLGTDYVFMLDALLGADGEHLRRWSEQIEYSEENTELLLRR